MELVATIGRMRGGFDRRVRDQRAERLALDLRRSVRDLSADNRPLEETGERSGWTHQLDRHVVVWLRSP